MRKSFFVIDLGGTTVDILRFTNGYYKHVQTIESCVLQTKNPKDWIFEHHIAPQILQDEYLVITGGKSLRLPDYYCFEQKKISLKKVHEFAAISLGAKILSGFEKGLAISMGTGTAMVFFENEKWEHVKGTGIGGGTLMGLSRALISDTITFEEVLFLAEKGSASCINMSVGDIIGGGIGELDATATASNFAKYSTKTSVEDIALGIVMLVCESIVSLAIEKSLRLGNVPIIGGGKVAKIPFLQQKMQQAAAVFSLPLIFPKDAGFMTAIGAGYDFF